MRLLCDRKSKNCKFKSAESYLIDGNFYISVINNAKNLNLNFETLVYIQAPTVSLWTLESANDAEARQFSIAKIFLGYFFI